MLWSLLWPMPFLLVAAAGVAVVLRAPAGPRWRVLALVGFALLGLAQLVELLRSVVIFSGDFGSSTYALVTVIGVVDLVITLAAMVLIVLAFHRVPRGSAGWSLPAPQ